MDNTKTVEAIAMKYNAGDKGLYIDDKDVTNEDWRSIAHILWELLDDIDTASDMFKPEMNTFYKYTMKKVGLRFNQIGSDGYELFVLRDRMEQVNRLSKMGNVTESIFSNGDVVIPMADIQHIEKLQNNGKPNGIWIITKHTNWNYERDMWDNPIFISNFNKKDESFLRAWSDYRSELIRLTRI